MGRIESQWATGLTRRRAVAALGGLLAAPPSWLHAQLDPRSSEPQRRTPSLDEMYEAFDFEPVARDNVNRVAWNWTSRAADSEWGLRRNRLVFDWIDLVERPGAELDAVDTATTLLGTPLSHPIYISPNTLHGMMHPTGEGGTYQGITATGGLMVNASGTSMPHEDIAAAADGPRWNQIYPSQNLEVNRNQLARWVDLGARAIVITVDQQAADYDSADRIRWLGGNPPPAVTEPAEPRPARTTLSGPTRYGLPGQGRLWYNWDFMERVRDLVQVPVLLKGILTAEDARLAVERGFHGVIVSNHGARTLEFVPSPMEALPEIVEAVAGRVPVLIDSGFRRGSDVFKALALGADAVGIGRVSRWGLGAFGPAGVQRAVEILHAELRQAMAATGRATIDAIDASAVEARFI